MNADSTSQPITKDDVLSVLRKESGIIRCSFMIRVGRNAGKVLDKEAAHEIQCLEFAYSLIKDMEIL